MENKEDTEQFDVIKDFITFEKSSYDKWHTLYENIKDDRKYIAGDQNDKVDKKLIGDNVTECRLNVVSNAVRTIVNTYLPNQYKWSYESQEELTRKADEFLADIDNNTAAVEALSNAIATGLGVLVFSTDYDIDGSVKPCLYSISDVTNVRLDPVATKLNFADSKRAAIIELKPKEWIEDTYGVGSFMEKPLIDIQDNYDHKQYMPLVTYYLKKDNVINVYKLMGTEIVEQIMLPYSYIPVVPVFGEQIWDDDKITFCGITKQMRPIQRLINYAYRQLILRCAKAPKNTWLADTESTENYGEFYKNSDVSLNPFLKYRAWSTDGKRQLPPPTRLPNNFEIDDVNTLMQNALGLTNTIIGIPATGLETDVEKSATEALLNQKTFNNNVRAYLYHLRYSMQLIGLIFAEDVMQQPLFGMIKVNVIEGPDEALKKQEARVTLQQMGALITNDVDKQKLLMAECAVETDNEYVRNFGQMLQPQPTLMEQQQQQMLEQANTEIQTRDQQIVQLQQRIAQLENDQKINAYSLEREMMLSKLKHQQDMEKIAFEKQIEQSNPAEQAKTEAEIVKAQSSVEKELIALRKEQMKAMQPKVGGNE
jgi:hypothetical protein